MCCFSRPVELIADTNIFARAGKDGKQYLVYAMTMSAKEDLAMILPIPTPKASKEDAVKFINLEKYPDFFKDMRAGFPVKPLRGRAKGGDKRKDDSRSTIKVVEVGSYEASFVTAVKDFSRLDERFRLPTEVWDKLTQYKDYGFVVFKLKMTDKEKGAGKVHPMAFEFPRADAKKLFFPTVHIHDGTVHEKAGFDHALYCQASGGEDLMMKWEESRQPAGLFMNIEKSLGLLEKDGHCYRRELRGQLKNEDIIV
jgi:hypothetical protein